MKNTQDNIKFWTVLTAMILLVSVAVLLIDMTIKAAILEESNALRRTIIGIQDDRPAKTDSNGASNNSDSAGSVLDKFPARMETRNVSNGTKKTTNPAHGDNTSETPREPRGGKIPEGD